MLFSFLKLEFKNSIKAVRKTLLGLIVTILILTVATAAVSFVIGKDNTVNPLKAAVIMHDDDSLSRMLVRYVSQTDSIRAISEFTYMDEDEAFDALDKGKVDIVIDIPPDFFNDINVGINTPVDVYTGKDAGFITDMFAEVIASGTGYVRTTEAAVYAFIDVSNKREYSLLISDKPIGDHIAEIYATKIMHRLRIFDSTVVSEYGTLGIYQFYFMTLMMILLMYSGLSFGYLYDKETASIENKLKVYGVNRIAVAAVKEIVMTTHLYLLSLIIYFAAFVVQKYADIYIFEFTPVHLAVLFGLSLSTAILYDMIYTVSSDNYGVQPVILLLLIISFIMAGIIMPYSHMPEWVHAAGRVIPLTYMKDYFTGLIYGVSESYTGALIMIPIVVIEQAVGVLCRER